MSSENRVVGPLSNPCKIGFIGLGIMGLPMAGHLLAAGNELIVHTRTKSKAEPLLSRGARWAQTPADATRQAEVIFVCVPDTPDVEQVVMGDGGIASVARKGQVVVDHSTISPAATRAMAEALNAKGVKLLDAPVSGGDVGARNATLAIMVGGDEGAFSQVRPLLEKMGKTITHVGPSGCGQLTKLTNNILVAINNLGVCEALTFAKSNGLDLQKTITAIAGGAAGSWQLSNLGPKMVDEDYRPGFMIKLQQKDLRLAAEAANDPVLKFPAMELVLRLFAQAINDGRSEQGTQALIAVVQGNSRQNS